MTASGTMISVPHSADLLFDLDRATSAARGLSGRLYYEQDVFELERDRVFGPAWVPAAFGSDVPNVGDVYPVSLAGWELLFVRGEDGVVRGFHNLCRHRGIKLVRQPGNVRSIICTYHCWGYDLRGQLKSTPNIGGVGRHDQAELDKSELGLVAIRTDVWHGLIFVNMDGMAEDLNLYMQPVANRLSRYDLSLLRQSDEGRGELDINANWKIFIEGGIEDYHLPFVHPETLVKYAENYKPEDGGDTYAGFSQAHSIEEARQRHKNGFPDHYAQLPHHPVVERDGRAEFIALFLFPLGNVTINPTGMVLSLTLPQTPTLTKTRSISYFVGEAATDEAHRPARQSRAQFFRKVVQEDLEVMEGVQAMSAQRESLGLKTRFSGYWEQSLHSFQRFYARQIIGRNG